MEEEKKENAEQVGDITKTNRKTRRADSTVDPPLVLIFHIRLFRPSFRPLPSMHPPFVFLGKVEKNNIKQKKRTLLHKTQSITLVSVSLYYYY